MDRHRSLSGSIAGLAVAALVIGACTSTAETTTTPPPTEATAAPTTTAAATPTTVAPTTVPEPVVLVSAEVSEIISSNCAVCHVALPSSHTGAQASDQCGLCHVPYGETTTPEHVASTEGCTACHATPESAHFYLRDEEDQTVLAADAEEKCIACHRDGGLVPDGRGVPALDTEESILASVAQGTLRAWIQPGGFMAHYLSSDETAVMTDWIDTITAARTLEYDPYLDAVKIDSDLEESDLLDSPAWEAAPLHVVSAQPTVFTAADSIEMKALYSNDYLYVRVEYDDSTASLTRSGAWLLEDGEWRHPTAASDNDKQSEDRVSIIWNIDTPEFFERGGCAIKCHGNVPGSSEFTDLEGSTMDIWHSKAARGLGVFSATDDGNLTVDTATEAFEVTAGSLGFLGVLDDKRLIWYMDLDDGYDLEDSGRRGDSGGSAYSHNRTSEKTGPVFIEVAPDSWTDAMVLLQDEIDSGETITTDPAESGFDEAAVTAAWEKYAVLGAVVPERVLRQPEGSRGDVLHAATWEDGVWINVFRRALVTGNADDTQFDLGDATEFDFSVAVFDNCGRGEIPPGHTTYGDGQYQILRFK